VTPAERQAAEARVEHAAAKVRAYEKIYFGSELGSVAEAWADDQLVIWDERLCNARASLTKARRP
jgi:hypothetical protein